MMRPSRFLRFLVSLAIWICFAGTAWAGGSLQVGTCRRDITPVDDTLAPVYAERFGSTPVVNHDGPVFMAGFDIGREATGYHDRLWARGVVLDGREGRVAIVAVDLIGYFVNEVETIRGLVSPESEIDYLIVHSTHEHEGPDTLGLWGASDFVSGIDFGYLDFVNAAVADCVDEAASRLEKARVRFATASSAGLSLGTDVEDDGYGVSDGKVLVGDDVLAPDTAGRIVDPHIAVMQLVARKPVKRTEIEEDSDDEGEQGEKHRKHEKRKQRKQFRVLATLVNFGSHPESLGSNNTLISSDYPHFVRERLEAEYGGLAIWVSGALGVLQGPLDIDVQDPVTGGPAARRSFRFAEVHGTQLAERAIEALAAAKKKGKSKPRIRFASQSPVVIRLDNPFFRLAAILNVLSTRRLLFTNGEPDDSIGLVGDFPFGVKTGEDLHTEVGALRIGDGSFAVVPGELDPQIAAGYRERMRGAKHTFIIGLGNDEIGYQMPKEKWDDSCHACAAYVIFDDEDSCPVQPIDCDTVFQNNVGREVDPSVSGAIVPLIDSLH